MFTPLCWTSRPDEWQPMFVKWAESYPETAELHRWEQFGGREALGLTLSAAPDPLERPFRLLVAAPFAHAPAPTAAMVDAASQLLTRRHLDQSISLIPKDMVLSRSLITLLPDMNPQGRQRSPESCWDGSAYDNDAFRKWAWGIDENGSLFGRSPEWRASERSPQRIGIVYEQVKEDLYVEPAVSRRSTFSKALDELMARYRYTHMLEMRQWECCEAVQLFPRPSDEEAALDWASRLVDAWERVGLHPRREPIPHVDEARRRLLDSFWEDRGEGMTRVACYIQNNRHADTDEPARMSAQFRGAHAALEASLRIAFAGCRKIG